MANLIKWFVAFFAMFGYILLACVILALPIMLLWNWLMPLIFGLCKLTFWQALGVNLLSAFLFKSNYVYNS